MELFSKKLRELRTQAGEKQIDVAKDIGVSIQSYSTYENGREPSFEVLTKISNHFNCTTDYLLGLTGVKNKSDLDTTNQYIKDLADMLPPLLDDPNSLYKHILSISYGAMGMGQREMMKWLNMVISSMSFASIAIQTMYYSENDISIKEFANHVNTVHLCEDMAHSSLEGYFWALKTAQKAVSDKKVIEEDKELAQLISASQKINVDVTAIESTSKRIQHALNDSDDMRIQDNAEEKD